MMAMGGNGQDRVENESANGHHHVTCGLRLLNDDRHCEYESARTIIHKAVYE